MKRRLCVLAVSVLIVVFGAWPRAQAGEVRYAYDGAGRLVAADYDNGKAITYAYDRNGNLVKRDITEGTVPVPDILCNFTDGPLQAATTTPITVYAGLAPGIRAGETAAWWIGVYTPILGPPYDWFTWVDGPDEPRLTVGINAFRQGPVERMPWTELLNLALPLQGPFTFFFAVDIDGDWVLEGIDIATVNVQ